MTDRFDKSEVADAAAATASSLSTLASQQKRGIRLTIFVLVAFIATVLLLFINKITSPRILNSIELQVNGTHLFDKGRILTDFELQASDGSAFTLANLSGRWTLVFLGFTNCPDICPTTLATLRDAYNKLRPEFREQVQIVLLTADPKRDTPEVLEPYIRHFHQDFTAVGGDFLTIKRLSGQLNMTFVKVMQGESYTVDHSANIALINPYGHYQGFIRPPFESSRIQLAMQSIMAQWPD